MVAINGEYEENRIKELEQMIREREVEIKIFREEIEYRIDLQMTEMEERNNENER